MPILFSCSSTPPVTDSDLFINEEIAKPSRVMLNRSEIRRDLSILTYALKNAYGGRKYVPQDTFLETVESVENIQLVSATAEELCAEVGERLFLIPDMHLSVRLNGKNCSVSANKRYVKGSVGPNLVPDVKKVWAINYVKVKKLKIPVLSINTLPSYEDVAWEGFEKKIGKIKNSASALIIDLRGNGGGSDSRGYQLASYLFGQDSPSSIQAILKSQTPATFALAANQPKLRILQLQRKNETVQDYLYKDYEDKIKKYQQAKKGELPEEKLVTLDGKPFDARKAFNNPIVVLTDRECASSCESIVQTLNLHPQTVTVGENTGGYLHFGNLGLLILPNSQTAVQIATDFWKYKDGRYLEGIGFEPKIRVQSGKDALDVAKSYLTKVLK